MNAQIENWCARSWNALGQLPGSIGGDLKSEWSAHQKREHPSVTFFGPYGSGKSSLLKRLLVDSGLPLPEGLTISARRESFELCEVQINGLTVRDTPGIAGGNAVHEQVALGALPSSDVIVIVLPYQGVTSEKALLLSILDGSRFGCSPGFAYASKGCAVVLSRMDEAGVDPRSSMGEYRTLIDRKMRELRDLLRNTPEDLLSAHAVCADPFALIGNARPEGRYEYDTGREWDGVEQFREFLGGLPARHQELKQHSEVRFLGGKLLEILEELRKLAAAREISIREWEHEAAANGLSINRLLGERDAARASLSRCIEEEIESAARRGATDATQLGKEVLKRLESRFQMWADVSEADLKKFLREADSETKTRWKRPSFENLVQSLGVESPSDDETQQSSRGKGRTAPISKIGNLMHKGFREFQEWRIGMPLTKAASEVQNLKSAGSFEKYLDQFKGKALLRDVQHAEIVENAVNSTKFMDVAVPALLELGPLLGEVIADAAAVKNRQENRERVRSTIRQVAGEFEEQAWLQWWVQGVPEAALESFKEQQSNAEKSAEALGLELEAIERTIESFETLLSEARKGQSEQN
jgi:hypothetical protein